jgi:cell division GTPase FtsZ
LFRGFGSSGDVELVKKHFRFNDECLQEFLQQTNLVIILVSLSGGTGSGTIDAALSAARQAGAFTIVIPLMPFSFEGQKKSISAAVQLQHLQSIGDLVFPFHSDLLLQVLPETATAQEAFEAGYCLLVKVLKIVSDCLRSRNNPTLGGCFNDFIHHFNSRPDELIWGIGSGNGDEAVKHALQVAFEWPMLRLNIDAFTPQRACIFIQTPSELPLYTLKKLYGDLQLRVNIENLPQLVNHSVLANDRNETTILVILHACTKNLKTERFRQKRSPQAVCDDSTRIQLDLDGVYAQYYWDTPTYLRRGLKLE